LSLPCLVMTAVSTLFFIGQDDILIKEIYRKGKTIENFV
jgi:hypothetical protein